MNDVQKFISQFEIPPDVHFFFNVDPSLVPVRVDIFKVIEKIYKRYHTPFYLPAKDKVHNFGLPRGEQKFKHPEYPYRLKELEKKIKSDVRDSKKDIKSPAQEINHRLRNELRGNKKLWKEEIHWIKSQQYYKIFGYWCYINGKATWIPPNQYSYMTTWELGNFSPSYRDASRLRHITRLFIRYNTETFAHLNKTTHKAIPEPDGSYKMRDVGKRTLRGDVLPKGRRLGVTNETLSDEYDCALKKASDDATFALCTFDEKKIEKFYQTYLLANFRKKKFWNKPYWKGSESPAKNLEFLAPEHFGVDSLGCKMVVAENATSKSFEGDKIYFYDRDEPGVTTLVDVNVEFETIAAAMSLGDDILEDSYATHPSTAEEFTLRGGKNFYKMCEKADFYTREDLSGYTPNGLVLVWFNYAMEMEGYIGEFGESIIENPTPEQAKYIGKTWGAKEYILKQIKYYEDVGDKKKCNSFKRKHPLEFQWCFVRDDSELGFDTKNIENRLIELRESIKMNPAKELSKGDFLSTNDGRSVFRKNENGRFTVSQQFGEGETCRIIKRPWFNNVTGRMEMSYSPALNRGVVGVDPYDFLFRTQGDIKKHESSLSDGGIAGFLCRDISIDGIDKEVNDFVTNHFVFTYSNRCSDVNIFFNDILNAAIYYGFWIYPERNKAGGFIKWLIEKGYGGFLLHDINPNTSKFEIQSGYHLQQGNKAEIFTLLETYSSVYICNEVHVELLEQMRDIRTLEQLEDYDLLAAGGGALKGSQHRIFSTERKKTEGDYSSLRSNFSLR